jgi:hypothetical protein
MQVSWYFGGGIVGLLITGALIDYVMPKRPYSLLVLINSMLLFTDIYLMATATTSATERQQQSNTFSFFLGMILISSDALYLCIMPLMISRVHSEIRY